MPLMIPSSHPRSFGGSDSISLRLRASWDNMMSGPWDEKGLHSPRWHVSCDRDPLCERLWGGECAHAATSEPDPRPLRRG